MPKFIVVDGMSLVFRAYFALQSAHFKSPDGEDTGAIFGFANLMLSLIEKESPDYLLVAFDTREPTFRKELYSDYKANRDAFPEDLAPQLERIKEFLDAMNITRLEIPGYEADDIIGTLGKRAEREGLPTYCLTSDKDMMQLVDDNFKILRPSRDNSEYDVIDRDGVIKKFGLPPEFVVDVLALMGDASDNIPGAAGIGEKTAPEIIKQYGNIESIYEKIDLVEKKAIKTKLENSKERVLLSKILATIKTDIELDFDFHKSKFSAPDLPKLNELLSTLGLNQIRVKVKRIVESKFEKKSGEIFIEASEPTHKTIDDVKVDYKLIDNIGDLESYIKELESASEISFDLETTSLDCMSAEIVGIALCAAPDKARYIALISSGEDETSDESQFDMFSAQKVEKTVQTGIAAKTAIKLVKPILENKSIKKCGQNAKYDALILMRYGVNVSPITFDSMVASYLIEPDEKRNMDFLSRKYLDYSPIPISALIGEKKGKQKNMREVEPLDAARYASEDADITLKLKNALYPELVEKELIELAETVEFPLIEVLTQIEFNGAAIDSKALTELSAQLGETIIELRDKIFAESGGDEFNIDSPKQLSFVLFEKMRLPIIKQSKTGVSSDISVLSELAMTYPIARLLIDYRKLQKLKNTYLDALPKLVNPKTGRIHTTYNQTVTSTGRLSSTDPNLQNIPVRDEMGREIRKAFCAQNPEWLILSADYSQIEIRIMAYYSQDETLINAFKNKEDVHSATAAHLFGVSLADVDSEMRRRAKTVNFGIMYGLGSFGLAQRLGIPRGEASQIIKDYFDKYPGIKKYIDDTIKFAHDNGFTKTLMGRKRFYANINANNKMLQKGEERAAVNMPIQGSAADMMKAAMINVYNAMKAENMQSKMIMQVHDELVFECPPEEAEKLKELVLREMINALPLGEVPIEVEAGIGKNWLEAH